MLLQHLPKRQSLTAQTVMYISEQIANRQWTGWLPSERRLCEELRVSRNTLRAALSQMQREKKIRTVHGAGNEILTPRGRTRSLASSSIVSLLTPEPIVRLRPMQALWIDDMRGLLLERGAQLRVVSGQQYFHSRPQAALRKLVAKTPTGCWILLLAHEGVQRWFAEKKIPCIVAGSTYEGIDLPFRDLDHRAMCRHAAGMLLGLGHRRISMLTEKSELAGDLESNTGFFEGVRQSTHADALATIAYHGKTVASVENTVRKLMSEAQPPTGLLVLNPNHFLTVTGMLPQLGLRIPQDVSVISRDDDPFLSFVVPKPTCYTVGHHVMAKNLFQPVIELLEGRSVRQNGLRFMPELVRGDSVTAAPKA